MLALQPETPSYRSTSAGLEGCARQVSPTKKTIALQLTLTAHPRDAFFPGLEGKT
ncbi:MULTISPECIES: hypothetical protein [unclassified Imperialibacter]|uniref:hypothetical protein n=1 Tax=unclassified Imperialibacter TaxID=2629706 RepID=UPI00186A5C6B|nr:MULTISPECIES: hypothetical protein [unclassified Imperialibacter]